MKHSTYKTLYQAHLGAVDKGSLRKIRDKESDSFYKTLIDLIVETDTHAVAWDSKPFTTDFLSGTPNQRLDETFFSFVLRIAAIIKEESYIRTFQKPESSNVIIAWVSILRSVLLSSLALLYNVQWTPESIISHLEPSIIKLFNEGDPSVLRTLMADLGIKLAQEEPYPAERFFPKLNLLLIGQFSSFYWRFLHWMAEAVAWRGDEMELYKKEWRQVLKGPLYRTLRCPICGIHFKKMLTEYDTELMAEYDKFPDIIFKMHNRTHAVRRQINKLLQEPDYTEAQYEADAIFMRKVFSP